MLTIIKGNKKVNISKQDLDNLICDFDNVHIDLGTGDGRYIYKKAQNNLDTYFIGIDPSQKQLEIYSKKANKAKLNNCLFILGSAELLPKGILGTATSVSIILPWGSLLGLVVQGNSKFIFDLKSLFSKASNTETLEIIFGYSQDAEPSESARLNLDILDFEYVTKNIVPAFENVGFNAVDVKIIEKQKLSEFETTWSKKLTYGQKRSLFYLKFATI